MIDDALSSVILFEFFVESVVFFHMKINILGIPWFHNDVKTLMMLPVCRHDYPIRTVEAGDILEDVCLALQEPLYYSAVMSERSLVGILDLEYFKRVGMMKYHRRDIRKRTSFFESVDALRSCPKLAFKELAFASKRLHLPINSVLMQQGYEMMPPGHIYVIVKGFAQVVFEMALSTTEALDLRSSLQLRRYRQHKLKAEISSVERDPVTTESVFVDSLMLGAFSSWFNTGASR